MSKRVLSAEVNHETNTFNSFSTTIDDYKERQYYLGDEIRREMSGTKTEIGAHIDAANHHKWQLIQPIAAHATPSGKTSAKAWAEIYDTIIGACKGSKIDGVLLALHGAMVTEGEDDAEGSLLKRLRASLGNEIPVAVTLDLHANVTDRMAAYSNILVSYRTYPHIDQYERAAEAADLLNQAMQKKIDPHSLVVRAPLLEGCDYGRTQGGPMSVLLEKGKQFMVEEPDLLAVSICAGFPWADIFEAGPSVTVTGNGRQTRFKSIAESLMRMVWDSRNEKTVPSVDLEQAMAMAIDHEKEKQVKPLVFGDFSDNPGAGGYGDGVSLLRRMLNERLDNAVFATIADPEAADACIQAGRGAGISLTLGAKKRPNVYGPPLHVTGTVDFVSDGVFVCDGPMNAGLAQSMGPTAVLRADGVRIIIASYAQQVTDRQVLISQGIDPSKCSIIAVKSWHHFRAAFEPIASRVILVDSGGLVSMDLKRFTYHRLRRPIWPLDAISDY